MNYCKLFLFSHFRQHSAFAIILKSRTQRSCVCVCGETNTLNHSLICKRGGYVRMRHNSLVSLSRHVARGARGSAAPRSKLVPLKKTQKMKPLCYCWQYRPQTQPIIDQATCLTVCKIGSLIVQSVYILYNWLVD